MKYTKEISKCSFTYTGSALWNELPDKVQDSISLDAFKSNHHFFIGWRFSLYTMAFLFIVLHMPYFSSQLIWYHCNFYVLFIYLCISSSNICVFNSQHCAHWYALVIALLYNIAMILLNSCSLYHVDVKAVLLHAYCTYAMVLRTRCQWRVELFQSDWLYHV